MSELFAIVFGDNKYHQYKIEDLLNHSFNGMIGGEYAYHGQSFYFPITTDGGQYFIEDRNSLWTIRVNGEQLTEKRRLANGDYIQTSGNGVSLAILIVAYESCSLSSNVYELKRGATYLIGRSEDMNVVLNTTSSVSRKHAAICINESGNAILEDLSGNTGVFVNGTQVQNYELQNGDHIFIMGTTMVFYETMFVIPSNISVHNMNLLEGLDTLPPKDGFDEDLYIRTPRIRKDLCNEPIVIDTPPAPSMPKEMPFILAAGPSLTMVVAMLASLAVSVSRVLGADNKDYISLIPSVVMAISLLMGALLWPKLSKDYTNRVARANEQHRQKKYREYLDNKEGEIRRAYERNIRIWNESLYPDCVALIENVRTKNRHLWERTNKDDDFLTVRLGGGERQFEAPVTIKKKEFELDEDLLKTEAYSLADKYQYMRNVPITLSFIDNRVSGVVGDYQLVAKNILTNLVTLYSPDELKIVMVCNQYQELTWEPFFDLPHMWSSDKKQRFIATTKTEAYSMLSELDEKIRTREESLNKDDLRVPYYVVFVFDQELLEGIPFQKTLVNNDDTCGVSGVFFGERFNQIPKECKAIIQRTTEVCGVYIKGKDINVFTEFTPDEITDQDMLDLVQSMSRVQMKEEIVDADVPEQVSFLDMYQVGNVDALNISSHWNSNNSSKTLAAPIGVMAGGDRFLLDIHEKYHGCHGLVAGTTGSGKSEFLQAYILSMMVNYSPKEVAFVLVDFKGGDMARPFLDSPHLAATISNLSGNTLYRALVSLEAEVKNRQRIFNEAAAELGIDKIDINSYHKYYKEHKLTEPLPHLVIIIDEFAQLKVQHPEFMAKLIDVAQVGRSLGVHLILATQKPSGVVDPQIWSNSRFKVCLKVMDRQDSSDMLNKPVAAMIKNPGRAYVQVGYDEVFQLIQSGYSGADYAPQDEYVDDNSITVSMVNWPAEKIREEKDVSRGMRTESTELEAVMHEIVSLGKKMDNAARKLWLEPLPEQLRYESLKQEKLGLGEIACGRIDLPQIQKQQNYNIDFIHNGHLAIYGSTGTGKSTLIHTIIYAMVLQYGPQEFQTFVMDYNGGSLLPIKRLPHCASYVTGDDEDGVMACLRKMEQIIKERRKEFAKANCANYESYRASGHEDMPIVLGIIDNYASFREKLYRGEDLLVQIIAAARACGIYFIVTGSSKGDIYYKVTDHIQQRIVFNMTDAGNYRDILNERIPFVPDNVRGRALVVFDKTIAEMQVAVSYDADSEVHRVEKLHEFYSALREQYGDVHVFDMSEDPVFVEDEEEEYVALYQTPKMERYTGTAASNAIILGIDNMTGDDITASMDANPHMFVANMFSSSEVVSLLCQRMIQVGQNIKVYSQRFPTLNLPEEVEITNLEQYVEQIGTEDAVLVIDGFTDFYDTISDEALELLQNVLRNSTELKTLVFDDMKRIWDYSSTELYLHLVKCEMGMIIGGCADNDLACLLNNDFYSISENERNVELSASQAIVYCKNTATYIQLEVTNE